MNEYAIAPWLAVVVIALTIWRALHGPYNDEWWQASKRNVLARLRAAALSRRPPD